MTPVIDTHCHIYPDKIAEKASAATGKFYNLKMSYDGKLDTLKDVQKGGRVTHSVIFSVATKPEQVPSINNYIARMVEESDGKFTGLGTMQQDFENVEEEVDRIISLGLKGIKLHPDIQGVAADDERLMRLYRYCEGKIPVLLHCGDYRYDYSNPDRIERILKTFPNLRVIGAHFAGWSLCRKASKILHGYDNLVVDCSSSFYSMSKEDAAACIREYGVDRVMFGSDYPMWNPEKELDYFLDLGFGEEDCEKILYKNACRVFGIDEKSLTK